MAKYVSLPGSERLEELLSDPGVMEKVLEAIHSEDDPGESQQPAIVMDCESDSQKRRNSPG